MSAMTTGISNVQSVSVKDSVFSTVSGTQYLNYYDVRSALDAGELCPTVPHLGLALNRP